MKEFMERRDLAVSFALSAVLDLMVIIAAPAHIPALLPLVALQGVLALFKFRLGQAWLSLRKALYFYYIAFSYICYLLVGALMGPELPLAFMVAYYALALVLVGWNLAVRIIIRKSGRELQAPKVVRIVWEWVDAILWSLIMVAVVNTFVFQIYVIPTESMVPTYRVGDRPFVLKALSGPTIPLTSIKLPRIHRPDRGDIIVVKNTRPQYDHSLKGEASRFFNDLLFMSTFTLVNLNVDRNGDPLADPLVKRVIAREGDRLSMVDNQLYVQKTEGGEWLKADWAPYIPVTPAPRVKVVPLPADLATFLDDQDAAINALDPDAWYPAARQRLAALGTSLKARPFLPQAPEAFDYQDANLHALTQESFTALLGGLVWDLQRNPVPAGDALPESLAFFLTRPGLPGPELYWTKCLRTELYLKGKLLDIVEALVQNDGSTAAGDKVNQLVQEWQNRVDALFGRYVPGYVMDGNFESRNLEPFPAQGRIGQDEYLAMGDNRYNSLDNRHFSTTPTQRRLVRDAEYSFIYYGINNPYTVRLDDILGFPLFKVWPFD